MCSSSSREQVSPEEERLAIRDFVISAEAHTKEGDTFYLITQRSALLLFFFFKSFLNLFLHDCCFSFSLLHVFLKTLVHFIGYVLSIAFLFCALDTLLSTHFLIFFLFTVVISNFNSMGYLLIKQM